jgi:hypothetical protein
MDGSLFGHLPVAQRPREHGGAGWLIRAQELALVLVDVRHCPDCNACGTDEHLRTCRRCQGRGLLKVPPAEWVEAGRRFRAERKRRGERDHDVAARMGCAASDVRAMERGELPLPSMLI